MRIPPYFPRLGALALACALALPALPAQAAERAWSYSYNALGLIERADGPRTDVQDVTLYAYDSRGNLTQVTNALGQVTRLGDYDERGKPGSITDANGVTSSLAYTGVDGWLASVSTAGVSVHSTTYWTYFTSRRGLSNSGETLYCFVPFSARTITLLRLILVTIPIVKPVRLSKVTFSPTCSRLSACRFS